MQRHPQIKYSFTACTTQEANVNKVFFLSYVTKEKLALIDRRKARNLDVSVLTRNRNQDAVGAERKFSQAADDRGIVGLANNVLGRRRFGVSLGKRIGRSSLSFLPF